MAEKSVKNLIGTKVIGQHGREIGRVQGALIDVDTWCIHSLKVRLDRGATDDLRVDAGIFRRPSVRIGVDQVAGVSDTLVLKCSLEGLRLEEADPETNEATPPTATSDSTPADDGPRR